MIKCNSRFGEGICVACMDSSQTLGGIISCDFAEACNFDEDEILKECDLAELLEVGCE